MSVSSVRVDTKYGKRKFSISSMPISFDVPRAMFE